MKVFISGRNALLLTFFSFFTFISCKKAETDVDNTRLANAPISSAIQERIPDSRKILLAVDNKDLNLYDFQQKIYTVTGLDNQPFKYPIFTGKENCYIWDVCPGPGVNNVYFTYNNFSDPLSSENGIWNVTMDGLVKKQILKLSGQKGLYEVDVDRVNNPSKLFWAEGIDYQHMEIWKANLDGSGKTKISIPGITYVGRFAVDGADKRIFFQYQKNGQAVVGSCNYDGKILVPVVAITDANNSNVFKQISVDIENKKLYVNNGYDIKVAGMNGANQLAQNFISSKSLYYGLTYDYPKANLYFTNTSDLTSIYSIDFSGNNEKLVLGGFSEVINVAGVFTY